MLNEYKKKNIFFFFFFGGGGGGGGGWDEGMRRWKVIGERFVFFFFFFFFFFWGQKIPDKSGHNKIKKSNEFSGNTRISLVWNKYFLFALLVTTDPNVALFLWAWVNTPNPVLFFLRGFLSFVLFEAQTSWFWFCQHSNYFKNVFEAFFFFFFFFFFVDYSLYHCHWSHARLVQVTSD